MTKAAKDRPVGKSVNTDLKRQLAELPHSKERSSEMLRRFNKPEQTKKDSERRGTQV